MALEHLSDEDLQNYKQRGLVGLSDEGLQHLRLPAGYGQPSFQDPAIAENGIEPENPAVAAATAIPAGVVALAGQAANTSAQGYDLLKELGADKGGQLGAIASGIGAAGSEFEEPKTALGAAANLLTLAPEALGGVRALAGAVGRMKVLPKLAEMQTKVPSTMFGYLQDNPETLDRALPIKDAGQLMNDVYDDLGLKSGKSMYSAVRPDLAAPKLEDLQPVANKVWQQVQALNQKKQQVSQTLDALSPQMAEAGKNFAEAETQFGQGSPEANAAHDVLHDVKNKFTAPFFEQKLLEAGEHPLQEAIDPQEVVAADHYMAQQGQLGMRKVANKRAGVAAGLDNLGTLRDYEADEMIPSLADLGNAIQPRNIPGYGNIDSLDKVRQIYYEAGINDKLSNLLPQNLNLSADKLRGFLTSMAAFTGHIPGALAAGIAQSPLAFRTAIQGVRALPELGVGNAAAAATGLANLFGSQESNSAK